MIAPGPKAPDPGHGDQEARGRGQRIEGRRRVEAAPAREEGVGRGEAAEGSEGHYLAMEENVRIEAGPEPRWDG